LLYRLSIQMSFTMIITHLRSTPYLIDITYTYNASVIVAFVSYTILHLPTLITMAISQEIISTTNFCLGGVRQQKLIFYFLGTDAFVFHLCFKTFIQRILPIFSSNKILFKKYDAKKCLPPCIRFFKKLPEKQNINKWH